MCIEDSTGTDVLGIQGSTTEEHEAAAGVKQTNDVLLYQRARREGMIVAYLWYFPSASRETPRPPPHAAKLAAFLISSSSSGRMESPPSTLSICDDVKMGRAAMIRAALRAPRPGRYSSVL